MDNEPKPLDAKQLVDRIDVALATLTKLHSELVDLKRHVLGQNPTRNVLALFDELWVNRYALGTEPVKHYPFNRRVDPAQVKRLLKSMSESQLQHAVTRYFADRDKFLVENKHPFNLFVSRLPRYIGDAPGESPEDVRGCDHQPRCKSGVEHTRKKMQELRS